MVGGMSSTLFFNSEGAAKLLTIENDKLQGRVLSTVKCVIREKN